jgi:glycosyltransferase involved in cell wall biosynthesis
MPSYRRGPKIAAALDSVFSQTLLPDEVIVVNDGSHCQTSQYIRAYYPTVRLIDVEHRGAALARNAGAEAATSRVIVFFDDDDVMLPHAVETLVGLLQRFPDARAAYTDHTFTNTATEEHFPNHHFALPQFAKLRRTRPMQRNGQERVYGRALFRVLLWGNLLQQPWAIWRDTFFAVGGFYPDLGASDDWDLYLRITRTVPIAISDAICSNHFLEKEKTTHLTLMGGQADVQIRVLERVRASVSWRDLRTRLTISHRLGLLHKWAGDLISARDLPAAWQHYWRASLTWPFDLHLLARCFVLWPLRLAAGRRTA